VRRTNQNRLIGPSIVPNPQFSAAWKTQWRNASFIKFTNFQIAHAASECPVEHFGLKPDMPNVAGGPTTETRLRRIALSSASLNW
jgi:hypothetical protein